MTPADIEALARRAGVEGCHCEWEGGGQPLYSGPAIAAMLALVRQEVIEECSRRAETCEPNYRSYAYCIASIAAAIRALKEKA